MSRFPVYALVDDAQCFGDVKCLIGAATVGLDRYGQNAYLIFVDALRRPNWNAIDEVLLLVRALVV